MTAIFEDSLCGRRLSELDNPLTVFLYLVGSAVDCIAVFVLLRVVYTLKLKHLIQTLGAVLSISIGLGLKSVLAVPRPPGSCLETFAAPSGDTQQLTAALYVLYLDQRSKRPYKAALSVVLVALEAYSRVHLGHHTVLQTLAGVSVGLLLTTLWTWLTRPSIFK